MKENKFIIIYSECLRSKIIYFNFLKKNKNNIKAIIEIPNFPNYKSNKNFFKKFILKSFKYILYQFIQVVFYNLISKLKKNSLAHLAKKLNIQYFKLSELPENIFLKKKIKNYHTKDIIFCSTMHILRQKHLNIKNIILNFHEAPLPKYRGSALYYYQIINNENYFHTTIMQPTTAIDLGKYEIISKKYKIKNLNVTQLLLLGYYIQSKIILKTINKKFIKINKKKINSSFTYKAYTMPSKLTEKKINKLKKNFTFYDFLFLIYILIINEKKLISKILNFINIKN